MPLHDFPLSLEIVQIGMVSSIGADVNTSCASARAGLTRPSELSYIVVGPDGDSTQATGHQADYITRGFRGDGRLIRLLAGALHDLSANVVKEVWPPAIDVYVAMPASFRDDPGVEIVRSSSPWESAQTKPTDLIRGRSIAAKAMAAAGIPSRIGGVIVITQGQASVGVALEAVALNFHSGHGRLALILAVDAPVDLDRVASLDARGRLKGPSVPAGAGPGEVGACMLVASNDLASSKRLPTVAQILQPQSLDAIPAFNADAAPDGRALSTLSSAVVERLPAFGFEPDAWCIVDMNGETYRAREWGTALVHLSASLPSVDTQDVWLPARHFGESGAAAGLAATALAVRGFARRYAPATSALILSAADGTKRAAFAVVESA
jgi:3-oxoacyl-[acyl-carrier-protein] synthase I